MTASTKPRNCLTADGRLYRKYDEKAFPSSRVYQGYMGQAGQCWRVSVAKQDLPRVLEVCHQLKVDIDPALLAPGAA